MKRDSRSFGKTLFDWWLFFFLRSFLLWFFFFFVGFSLMISPSSACLLALVARDLVGRGEFLFY